MDGYTKICEERSLLGNISRFLQIENTPISVLAQKVRDFLNANPQIFPLFPIGLEELEQKIVDRSWLIVNGSARRGWIAAFTDQSPIPKKFGVENKFLDLFTKVFVVEPVICSENHSLEKSLLTVWMEQKGNICPYSGRGQHPITEVLEVDEQLAYEVEEQRATVRELMAEDYRRRFVPVREATLQRTIENQNAEIIELKPKRSFRDVAGSGVLAVASFVPGIQAAAVSVGISVGAYRIKKGHVKEGIASIVAGCMAAVPGGRQVPFPC
ncbi:MAG TPA: hypothetical protein P5048_04210 [Chlamydiales bacterium]|nr:hypothetical protein [Chlamydiales bacterium]